MSETRHEPPIARCSECYRRTWEPGMVGRTCYVPLPNGGTCAGVFRVFPPQQPTTQGDVMTRFSAVIEGLQILAKYEAKGFDAHINGADHDIIWAASGDFDEDDLVRLEDDEEGEFVPRDRRLTDEDQARLVELGWHVDDRAESWAHYC